MASVYSTSQKHSYGLSHHSSLHIFAIYIAQNNKNILQVLVYYSLTLLSTALISGLRSLGSVYLSVSTISLRCFLSESVGPMYLYGQGTFYFLKKTISL